MLDIRKNTVSHRVVDTWNGSDGRIVSCNSSEVFLKHVSRWIENF